MVELDRLIIFILIITYSIMVIALKYMFKKVNRVLFILLFTLILMILHYWW